MRVWGGGTGEGGGGGEGVEFGALVLTELIERPRVHV